MQVLYLSNTKGEKVDFYDYTNWAILADGHDIGAIPTDAKPRVVTIRFLVGKDAGRMSLETLRQNLKSVRDMLSDAAVDNHHGLGRTVRLVAQPDGASVPTTFWVIGGTVEEPAPWTLRYLATHQVQATMKVAVENTAYGPDTELISNQTLRSTLAGVTHMFVNQGGTWSVNMAAVMDCGIWQISKFSDSGVTVVSPASGNVLYFGNSVMSTYTEWSRLYMGIRVARTGTWTGVWEYSTGAGGWAALTTASDFRSGDQNTEFDTIDHMGSVSWTPQSNWVTNSVNGVTAYWIRYRLTGFTSQPVAPIRTNGLMSDVGLGYIPDNEVKGDKPATALVEITNPNAGNAAGVRAGIINDRLGTGRPPPICLPWAASDVFTPSSGSNTAVLTSDIGSVVGEAVKITFATTVTDGAVHVSGGQYLWYGPASGNKLAQMMNGHQFTLRIVFKLSTLTDQPTCLMSQWDGGGGKSWWFGIDRGQLRLLLSKDGNNIYSVSGTTTLQTGRWYTAGLGPGNYNHWRIYLDGHREGDVDPHAGSIRAGGTTQIQIGNQSGWSNSDSRSGSDSATGFDGYIDYVDIGDGYDVLPGAPVVTSNTILLLMLNETSGSTATDSASSPANFTYTSTSVPTQRIPGFYQTGVIGVAGSGRMLGMRLPICYGEEYAGDYRVYLRAKPDATLSSVDDLLFQIQFNVGDSNLAFQSVGRKFPDVNVPGSSRYYLLDMGPVRLPPAPLESYRGTDSSYNFLDMNLFVGYQASASACWVDCVYLIPTNWWLGDYTTFRDVYDPNYAVSQNEKFVFDSRGRRTVFGQAEAVADTADGYPKLYRNPYARPTPSSPKLPKSGAIWVFAMGLEGSATGIDNLQSGNFFPLQLRVRGQGRWEALANG